MTSNKTLTLGLYEAVRHGVPSVRIPRHLDQHDNCNKLRELGLTKLLPLLALTSDRLTAAIDVALSSEADSIRDKVRAASAVLQREDGLEEARRQLRSALDVGVLHLLQPQPFQMYSLQYWNVDMLLFWGAFVGMGSFVILAFTCSTCLSLCCGVDLERARERDPNAPKMPDMATMMEQMRQKKEH